MPLLLADEQLHRFNVGWIVRPLSIAAGQPEEVMALGALTELKVLQGRGQRVFLPLSHLRPLIPR
jgi:hypothetical protein